MILFREWLNDKIEDSEDNPVSFIVVMGGEDDDDASITLQLSDCSRRIELDFGIYNYGLWKEDLEGQLNELKNRYQKREQKLATLKKGIALLEKEMKKSYKRSTKKVKKNWKSSQERKKEKQ